MPLPTVQPHPAITRLLAFFETLVHEVTAKDDNSEPQLRTIRFERHGDSLQHCGVHVRLYGGSGQYRNVTDTTFAADYDPITISFFLPTHGEIEKVNDPRLFALSVIINIPKEFTGKLAAKMHLKDFDAVGQLATRRLELANHFVNAWNSFFQTGG